LAWPNAGCSPSKNGAQGVLDDAVLGNVTQDRSGFESRHDLTLLHLVPKVNDTRLARDKLDLSLRLILRLRPRRGGEQGTQSGDRDAS